MDKKVWFLSIGITCLSFTFLYAEPRIQKGGMYYPAGPGQRITEAVYMTSTTCSPTNPQNVIISSRPAYFFILSISSAGDASSRVRAYDASTSTSTDVRPIKKYIQGSVNRDHFINVHVSSGIAVDIQTTASPNTGIPCVDIIYVEQ